MSDFLFSARYTPNENLGGSTTLDLSDIQSVNITLGSEIRNDTMEVVLKNPSIGVFSDGTIKHNWLTSGKNPVFRAIKVGPGEVVDDELINIYSHYTDSDPTINVQNNIYNLFNGIIDKAKIKHNSREHTITLPCVNRNSIILNKISVPQAIDLGDAKNSPEIQKQLIQRAASGYSGNALTFDSNGVEGLNFPFTVDARLFSEGIVDSGTATSTSTRKLIDSGQNFQTTVDVGDWVRNTSTNKTAYVVSVDSDTQLTLTKDIFTSTDAYQISDGFIQDFRSDGTVFPDIAFSTYNKPLAQNLDELSQINKTNSQSELDSTLVTSRRARFFIDLKNRYHWYLPEDTPELIMKVGTTSAISPDTSSHVIYGHTLDNDIVEEVNFIIYKAGEDMDNIQIVDGLRAPFSGRPQVKDSFRDFSEIARQMKLEEIRAGNITQTKSDEFAYPASYNPLPGGGNYPSWDNIKSSIPTSDSTYNAAFKAEAIRRANDRCRVIFSNQSDPRWKGTIRLKGEHFNRGDLIKFTDTTHGIIDVLVRITKVSHVIQPQTGWVTTLTVEQDEPEQVI